MRAAVRVITGCPRSTPVVPLMAEAGLVPVRVRRGILAAPIAQLGPVPPAVRSTQTGRGTGHATAPHRHPGLCPIHETCGLMSRESTLTRL